MPRRLSPEERALWARVTGDVRAIDPAIKPADSPMPGVRLKRAPIRRPDPIAPSFKVNPKAANTLDAGWDKRIAKGVLQPDFTIDLHGETLRTAHAKLNRSIAAAIRAEARVVLLITGKAASDNPRLPPTSRGVIRASVKDWLAASPHAGQFASLRGAHPRHGGAGALYLILRRSRG